MSSMNDGTASAGMVRLARFARNHPGLMRRLGDIETRWVLPPIAERPAIDRPVYVCGLARSGSTILLEMLAEHPDVATHRYRDFPLLHVPVWWNRFLDRAARGEAEPTERFHKDRIAVTADSPEAMEEVLWMAFFPDQHDPGQSSVLDENTQRPDFEAFYADHIRKILMLRQGTRYVAKGNYNLVRMRYLRRIFPDARFVVPVRDPVTHIASLLKQHRLFCKVEKADPRNLEYMQLAGHFEFGLDRRFVNVGDAEAQARIGEHLAAGREAHALAAYWASLYGFAARALEADPALAGSVLLVHYSDLCDRPEDSLRALYDHAGLATHDDALRAQAARIAPPGYYRPSFSAEETDAIHEITDSMHERLRRLCAGGG